MAARMRRRTAPTRCWVASGTSSPTGTSYDTPAGSPPGRDRRVNILDIGALVLRFGTVSSPPPTEEEALAEALTLPPDETGYHAAFDRGGPIPGQDLWNLLPPNGSINIIDIGASIVQFGDTCFQSP